MKKEKPSAICSHCGKVGSLTQINQKCFYCNKGIYKSMLKDDDWIECYKCKGYGTLSDGTFCDICERKGYIPKNS